MTKKPSRYPSALAERPGLGDGTAVTVAPGVYWLRMPVDSYLEAVNVWLLEDEDGWTVVDTGMRTAPTATAWRLALDGLMAGKPVKRVIVTHLHPDHSGMAGWLYRKTGAPLCMSRLEYLTLRVMAADRDEAPDEAIAFYRACGWDEASLDDYRARFGRFGAVIYAIPNTYQALRDQMRMTIGGRSWEVVIGSGHSPEHVSLYCPEAKLLISGDQVLPDISSNVSVYPVEPEGDPLSDWLRTLAILKARVPADTLVLPSHGDLFHGLHQRIAELIDGHEDALVRLAAELATPRRATDVFSILFKRPITGGLMSLATGESMAHLSCLRSRGLARDRLDEHGIRWWEAHA